MKTFAMTWACCDQWQWGWTGVMPTPKTECSLAPFLESAIVDTPTCSRAMFPSYSGDWIGRQRARQADWPGRGSRTQPRS